MISLLEDKVPFGLAQQLADFERGFSYPLDPGRTFQISHGADYLRFFRGMGKVRCFVARNESSVRGVLTIVERQLHLPGCEASTPALYLCDLKVPAGPKRLSTFLSLVGAARGRFDQTGKTAAYSIVMKGTASTPDAYTGSFGIPYFKPIAEVAILRIPVQRTAPIAAVRSTAKATMTIYKRLSAGHVHLEPCSMRSGSLYPPVAFVSKDRRACAVLVDTLRAKRLLSGGTELVSAHLSHFVYEQAAQGAHVVAASLRCCEERGVPALFVSVPQVRLTEFLAHNDYAKTSVTSATVYGLGLPTAHPWNINTSEI